MPTELVLLGLFVSIVLLAGPGPSLGGATAGAAPPQLWTSCDSEEPNGRQCRIPRGVAANPLNGRVFVGDSGNRRIVELTARGEFVKAWGWDVTVGGGESFEICIPENGDICKAGTGGSSSGQFAVASPQGLAVDSVGSVYVVDRGLPSNQRVQKFDRNGNFILMFGGEVNKTKVDKRKEQEANLEPVTVTEQEENLCPVDPGDVCQKGSQGTGKGEFGEWSVVGDWIDININDPETAADDRIYVGDRKRVQVFDTDGNYLQDLPLDPAGALKDSTVQSLAVDSDDNLYVIYQSKADVRKLTAAGKELAEPRFEVKEADGDPVIPTAVAVDSEGDVYAFGPINEGSGSPVLVDPIWKFDPAGNLIERFGKGEYGGSSTGLATNLCPGSEEPGNLYATNPSEASGLLRAYGTDPAGCFKAVTKPADPVEETSATLNGSVNPKGGTVSECFFRWGETDAYGNTAPCVPDAGSIGSGSSPVPVDANISGLTRGTIYHFRLIAKVDGETESGSDLNFKTKGPPVISNEHVLGTTDSEAILRGFANPEGFATSCHFDYGTTNLYGQSTPEEAIGSDRKDHLLSVTLQGLEPGTTYHWRIVCTNSSDTTEGADRVFATFELSGEEECPANDAFRAGASAFLPDCRAYEMVSPVEKNGANILFFNARTAQAALDGNSITYNAAAAFGDVQTSLVTNQYLASRRERGDPEEGWSNHGIHPPIEGRAVTDDFYPLGTPSFFGFTPDLCSAWIFHWMTVPPTPEGQPTLLNLYRRDNCEPGEGGLEALTDVRWPQGTRLRTGLISMLGVADDGSHAIFGTESPLLPDCRTTTKAKAISFQWLRNGVPIAGATNPVYTQTEADEGKTLQCQVFAINENAGSTQVANPAVVIPPEPGVELAPPIAPNSIAQPAPPSPTAGTVLTCEAGAWTEASQFSFQWYRNGAAIPGASSVGGTSSTYEVQAADVPGQIQCAVTGTNSDGAVTKVSNNRNTNPAPSSPVPTANASHGGELTARIYDRSGGELQLASVLPGGEVPDQAAGAGIGFARDVEQAVSDDGSRVYWAAEPLAGNSIGKIFMREHPEQGIVADECTPGKACTVPVSLGLEGAYFWGASADGTKALYLEGDVIGRSANLREFNLNPGGSPQRRLLAEGVEGVLGASEDLSHVYFVSHEALAPGASEGDPNIYLDQDGTLGFVATLAEEDVTEVPGISGRVSPDGSRAVFLSRAPLTGYDNTDRNNGKADLEVFAYEPGGDLHCVSCNPSGARPVGREFRFPFWAKPPAGHGVFAAAWIPAPEQALHASNVVSSDGERIFFNSNDALLARDTNGTMDVYQWEAPGKGGCTEDHPSYFPQNGGCIDLISSGESPFESEFWEATPSGDDVFFTTESSLVEQDPGLVDLYDARVGGGFPSQEEEPICEGEACQSPPPPPAYQTPSSSSYQGPGNLAPPKAKAKRCPKGKRKVRRGGKVRCLKRRKAGTSGRNPR